MPMARAIVAFAALFASPGEAAARMDLEGAGRQSGLAAWYGGRGHVRGMGRPVLDEALTAAHRKLPLGVRVRVTNRKNGQSVEVTITDRGPRSRRRIIDVSREAARRLGMLGDGTTRVTIEVVEP